MKKDIKYFYPATFSPWKLQRKIAYLGKDLYCCGTIQPDGMIDYQAVVDAGCTVEVGYFPVEHIRDLYRRSEHVIIPAIHGSERTCLEAMACDILPEVINPGNIRTMSYIDEYNKWKETHEGGPREFVLQNYSHLKFCNQLRRGIE